MLHQKWKAMAALAVLGVALVVAFELVPRIRQTSTLHRRWEELSSAGGQDLAAQRERLQNIRDALRLGRSIQGFTLLPHDQEPALLEGIHRLAADLGLVIDRWTPGPLVFRESHAERTVQIQLRGGFLPLGRFIERLEHGDPPAALRAGRIERLPDTLVAQLELTFFLALPDNDAS